MTNIDMKAIEGDATLLGMAEELNALDAERQPLVKTGRTPVEEIQYRVLLKRHSATEAAFNARLRDLLGLS